MSRTYRKSAVYFWYPNSESYNRVWGNDYSDYEKYHRDGKHLWIDNVNKSLLKKHTNKNIRNKTKKLNHILLKDVESFEDMVYPGKNTEKYLWWIYD